MKNFYKRLVGLLGLGGLFFLGIPNLYQAIALTKNQLVFKFNEIDSSLNTGEGFSRYTNEGGVIGWAQSYLFVAYLDMYEATRDVKYIEKFVSQADRVIANTDRERNLRDYRERLLVGWGSTRYNKNDLRVVHLVHTGMIAYPLVRFAMLVNHEVTLRRFTEKAKYYTNLSIEALSVFEEHWNYDEDTREGFYTASARELNLLEHPSSLLLPLPMNAQLAAGRTAIMLCQLEVEGDFCKKAEALAKYFKNRIFENENGSYVWRYWDNDQKIYQVIEDMSHGGIDTDFAVVAYRNNIVFELSDIFKFIKTYTNNINPDGTIAWRVDGTGESRYEEAITIWMELAEYDCKVWQDFQELLETNNYNSIPLVMLGLAKSAKYYERCAVRER